MNTVGAATSSEGAYTYIRLYTYVMLYYTYTLYILCMHKRKKRPCQDQQIKTLITQCALQHCIKHLVHTYIHI
jgi:hypothetical protein